MKNKTIGLANDVALNLQRLSKIVDGRTGKLRTPSRTIKKALKKAGMWKDVSE